MAGDSGEIFSATKGAIAAFSRSLARSLAPTVRVNCLAPGWIKTAWGEQASDAWQQRAIGESLLRALGHAGRRCPRRAILGVSGRRVHHRSGDRNQRRPKIAALPSAPSRALAREYTVHHFAGSDLSANSMNTSQYSLFTEMLRFADVVAKLVADDLVVFGFRVGRQFHQRRTADRPNWPLSTLRAAPADRPIRRACRS